MAKYFTQDDEGNYSEAEGVFEQSDVDRIVKDRLERNSQKFADYDDVKKKAEKVDTIETEWKGKQKSWEDEKTTLTKDLGAAKLETSKVKIKHEFKLSDDLDEFLTGDTEEDIRKRAEKLAKGIKPGGVVIDKDKKPNGGEDPTPARKIAGKLFGKKSDD